MKEFRADYVNTDTSQQFHPIRGLFNMVEAYPNSSQYYIKDINEN